MREYSDFLHDIKTALKNIDSFIGKMDFEQFSKDSKTNKAVMRCLEEIGEAAKNIPEGVRKEFPDVPWKEAAGLRDKLIHYYWGVDLKLVWEIVKFDLPQLKKSIKPVKI